MIKALIAGAAMMVGLLGAGQATDTDGAGCTEDEYRVVNMCIHVEGDGYRYLGR